MVVGILRLSLRTWYRPSLEVVGVWGGFTGEGIKTVLPKEAHAKISGRIVSVLNLLKRTNAKKLRNRLPNDMQPFHADSEIAYRSQVRIQLRRKS